MERKKRHFTVIVLIPVVIGIFFSSCRHIESITSDTSVRVDTVSVPAVVPEYSARAVGAVNDSLVLDDDKLRVVVRRVIPRTQRPDDEQTMPTVPIENDIDDFLNSAPNLDEQFEISATIKPDTVKVKVPQTTITERTQRTVTETKTGWLAWITIGGLLAVVIILLVAFRIRT